MDALRSIDESVINSLSTSDKQELQRWLLKENDKMQLTDRIHGLTNKCFAKCVKSGQSASLEPSEQGCMAGCIRSFLDMNALTVKQLQKMQGSS